MKRRKFIAITGAAAGALVVAGHHSATAKDKWDPCGPDHDNHSLCRNCDRFCECEHPAAFHYWDRDYWPCAQAGCACIRYEPEPQSVREEARARKVITPRTDFREREAAEAEARAS